MNLHENKANLVATNCHVELGAERGKAMERELVVGFDSSIVRGALQGIIKHEIITSGGWVF